MWTQFVEWAFSEEGGFAFIVKALVLALVFVALWSVAKIVSVVTGKAMKRVPNISNLLKNFVTIVVFWITISIGLLIVLSAFGVNIGGLLALVGGASFIVAFALQSTLSNFAAGLMIMIYKPFDVGNYVTVAGVAGTVKAVSLVSTTITTPDNQVIVVPNSNIWGNVITNVTGSDTRRVDLVFGIGYQDDAQAAQQIMEEVVAQHELVLKEPAPVVRLHELGRVVGQFRVPPVDQDLRLLGGVLGHHATGQGAVRRRRDLDPLPAARRPPLHGRAGQAGLSGTSRIVLGRTNRGYRMRFGR